jgi:hypothetical protein
MLARELRNLGFVVRVGAADQRTPPLTHRLSAPGPSPFFRLPTTTRTAFLPF